MISKKIYFLYDIRQKPCLISFQLISFLLLLFSQEQTVSSVGSTLD